MHQHPPRTPPAYPPVTARSAISRCVTATPLGVPVDPDVNITYAS